MFKWFTNKIKGETIVAEKIVVATIDEEEVKVFLDLEHKLAAIKGLQTNLIEQFAEVMGESSDHWKVIQEKYDIQGDLTLNHTTREIKKG